MTTGIRDWSTTAGNNNSPAPNGAPEGMPPSGVNDVIRQNMASVREWYEDKDWIDYGHAGLTYVDETNFRVTGDQTAIYTVNRRVRAIGATPFTVYGTITAVAFSSPNTTVTVSWDSTSMNNTLSEIALGTVEEGQPTSSTAISFADDTVPLSSLIGFVQYEPPIGQVSMFSGAVAPTSWIICDGREVSRTTYADLFTTIGTTFGIGDGSTTFNLPDFRGRSPIGVGQGITGEGDVTGTNRSLADKGGYETHTLTEDELASHTHTETDATTGGNVGGYGGIGTRRTRDSGSAGGDQPHNNMHPFLAVNFIIYSGV